MQGDPKNRFSVIPFLSANTFLHFSFLLVINNPFSATLYKIALTAPDVKAKGNTHNTVIPNIPKKAIETATEIEISPPIKVPASVANGINNAIKNNTKRGATKRWVT